MQSEQGELSAALSSYQRSLAIRARLVKADSGNAAWQRDLAVSHGRLGTTRMRQGSHDEAASALRQGREIIAQLVQRLPDNPTLRADLAWFDSQIAVS